VFSVPGQDTLRVFKINATGTPLTEITSYNRLFPAQPLANQATVYGRALWRDAVNDKLYSLVAQRGGSGAGGAVKGHSVAQFKSIAQANGTVTSSLVRSWNLPAT
jgi:myo-inositol-hexaphosphate 3-phosphohydrolase